MQSGTVERESAEDSLHHGGASDLLDQPAEPDWARPELFEANAEDFESAEIQQKAMDAVRDMLKAKIASSTAAYDEKVKANPLDPERGAPLIGSKPGLMRYMPEGLREFSLRIKPGAVPQRSGSRRFNQTETDEIRRQGDKMLKAEVIAACYSPCGLRA